MPEPSETNKRALDHVIAAAAAVTIPPNRFGWENKFDRDGAPLEEG